jgi:predicted nucleotidyltransferase
MGGYSETRDFSEKKLSELRARLPSLVPDGQLVVTCGSYARREASPSSDMDFYSVLQSASSVDEEPAWSTSINDLIEEVVGKLPSRDGAFAKNIPEQELFENYGGSRDSNETITRRMLYLLEGDYLTEESKFYNIRERIITRYVDETPLDHQLALYLLNDIVRYWRTLAVDYADKTYGATSPKPWAVRNIKLIYSRKLIYASGLFAVALTADRTRDKKIQILMDLFRMSPIDRIRYVSGGSAERLLDLYNVFLSQIGDAEIRAHLDALPRERKADDPLFRSLKNEGHYFSRELMSVFSRAFHSSHPIHMAVIF